MKRIFCLTLIAILSFQNQSASAATGYRYWGYFQAAPGVSTWSYAQTGPTTLVPDGAVEGWVFTFSGSDLPEAAAPKVAPRFATICGRTKVDAQRKRVALVIDFGPAALRPSGEKLPRAIVTCASVTKNATGGEILASVAKVRNSASGLLCSINSYPAKECGAEIKTPRALLKK